MLQSRVGLIEEIASSALQFGICLVQLRLQGYTLKLLELEGEFSRARLQHTLLRAHAAVVVSELVLDVAL